jgi:hypothetical protein
MKFQWIKILNRNLSIFEFYAKTNKKYVYYLFDYDIADESSQSVIIELHIHGAIETYPIIIELLNLSTSQFAVAKQRKSNFPEMELRNTKL